MIYAVNVSLAGSDAAVEDGYEPSEWAEYYSASQRFVDFLKGASPTAPPPPSRPPPPAPFPPAAPSPSSGGGRQPRAGSPDITNTPAPPPGGGATTTRRRCCRATTRAWTSFSPR